MRVVENVAPFGIESVQLVLSDWDGNMDWYQSRDTLSAANGYGGQGSIFRHSEEYRRIFPHIDQSRKPIRLDCMRIDSFCAKVGIDEIDVAHIDVERAEYQVIIGMGSMRPGLIFVEASPLNAQLWIGTKSSGDVHRLLSKRGYILAGDFASDRLYVTGVVADMGRGARN